MTNNQTLRGGNHDFSYYVTQELSYINNTNISNQRTCGSLDCNINTLSNNEEKYDIGNNMFETTIPDKMKYMLLSIYLGCGVMGVAILMTLLDKDVGSKRINADLKMTTKELFMATVNMLKDSRCQLLIPLVLFVGLEQGFIFGDFTKVNI